MSKRNIVLTGLAAVALAPASALAGPQAAPSDTQRTQQGMMNDVPHCRRKIGTVSIANGDDPRGWRQYDLAPPQKLLKVLVQRSHCFNIVDRAAGLNAARGERRIGNGLGLQRGSNVGRGQVKAADYVLVAEVQAANRDSGGGGIGGAIGGLVGGRVGGLIGGVDSKKMEANTVLSLTNVRTTETIAVEDGYAAKNSISFAAGSGLGFFGGAVGAVGGGYDNTRIGRIVTLAFIQAYAKMVDSVARIRPGDAGTAQAAPSKVFTARSPVAMHKDPGRKAPVIRTLPVGATVYPTGPKDGLWWQVADENDNVGWVLNVKLSPAR